MYCSECAPLVALLQCIIHSWHYGKHYSKCNMRLHDAHCHVIKSGGEHSSCSKLSAVCEVTREPE